MVQQGEREREIQQDCHNHHPASSSIDARPTAKWSHQWPAARAHGWLTELIWVHYVGLVLITDPRIRGS